MKHTWLLLPVATALGISCNDPATAVVNQLNLDRPVSVSFACYGSMRRTDGRLPAQVTDPIEATAQSVSACEALSPLLKSTAAVPVPGQEKLEDNVEIKPAWYAFILQSASGTVALATWPVMASEEMAATGDLSHDMAVIDADALTPGKNSISIGEDPIAIATDRSGCFEVTANAGSCDLSQLEINSALDNLRSSVGTMATPVKVGRTPVTNTRGDVILARPATMVAEPGTDPVGFACPAKPTGRVYIAYPSCHLVARVDMATGKIVAGIQYNAGVPTILSGTALDNVTCPAECTSGTSVGTATIANDTRPVALDLRYDPRVDSIKTLITNRLAIGADNSNSLTVVDLDPVTSDPVALSQVSLEDPRNPMNPKLGVTSVALSPQIGMGGDANKDPAAAASDENTPGGQGQYVYAVATDGTVRVADVLNVRRECDTQIDPRFLRGAEVADLQCLAAGDPLRPRRSGARGPGIELPGHAVPASVAIFKGRTQRKTITNNGVMTPVPPDPLTLLGYFAIVASSVGAAYVVNIDDDYAPDQPTSDATKLSTVPALVMAHQLRDVFRDRRQGPDGNTSACTAADPVSQGGALAGGPRISTPPAVVAPTGSIAPALLSELPTLRQVECRLDLKPTDAGPGVPVAELQFAAPPDTRDVVYPDLMSVASETWALTYEGTLSLDPPSSAVDGPPIRSGAIGVDSFGMHLADPAHPFCDMGVEPYDIVDLRGCDPANGDGDCPRGYVCFVHPKSQVSIGACMLANEAPRLADACADFLTTLRRYTVGRADSGELVLLERKHELSTTPLDGCDSDDQCNRLAQVALTINGAADPFLGDPAPGKVGTRWRCLPDPLRAPINTDPARNNRCVQVCSTDDAHPTACANGSVCRLEPGTKDGVCVEGVEPPQSCVNGPQRYDVRASEAFTVVGGQSGYVHPIVTDSTGACTRPTPADPLKLGRIPLKAPPCGPVGTTNQYTGALAGGGFEPNPCSLTVTDEFDTKPITYQLGCGTPVDVPGAHTRSNVPAIKFRNRSMTLTLVDPYYGGAGGCPLLNPATDGRIPLAIRGYQLEFAQKAGFRPVELTLIGTTTPVKVMRGPSESIWVIDDGDFLSNSITQASTRGRVYRVEMMDINIFNLLD